MNNDYLQQIDDKIKYDNDNIEIFKRRLRGLTQRILLLDIVLGEDNDVFFKILGSSNNIYTIHVWLDYVNIKCSCTCPDNKYRNIECKHILWLSLKKLYKADLESWSIDDINNLYYNWYNTYSYPVGRNNTCPICLEDIDYNKENTIGCTNSCNNSVHSFCWNKYYVISKSTRCVICRKLTMPILYE